MQGIFCICKVLQLCHYVVSVNQVAILLVMCDFIMDTTHLTFASASTLGLSDSEHSVAFKNLSRKSNIVGTQI